MIQHAYFIELFLLSKTHQAFQKQVAWLYFQDDKLRKVL